MNAIIVIYRLLVQCEINVGESESFTDFDAVGVPAVAVVNVKRLPGFLLPVGLLELE